MKDQDEFFVVPKRYWLEQRIRELEFAIMDYKSRYAYSAESPVRGWEIEIKRAKQEIKYI